VNALGQQVAGTFSNEVPFFAALLGTAAVGTVAARALRRSAHEMNVVSQGIKRSVSDFFGRQAAR